MKFRWRSKLNSRALAIVAMTAMALPLGACRSKITAKIAKPAGTSADDLLSLSANIALKNFKGTGSEADPYSFDLLGNTTAILNLSGFNDSEDDTKKTKVASCSPSIGWIGIGTLNQTIVLTPPLTQGITSQAFKCSVTRPKKQSATDIFFAVRILPSGSQPEESPAPTDSPSANPIPAAVVVTVTPPSFQYINLANVTTLPLAGSCSENGRQVSISVTGGAVVTTPICQAGTWATTFDASSFANGSVTLFVDHTNQSGTAAPTAAVTVAKDTLAPIITISAPALTTVPLASAAAYLAAGTCSEANASVSVGASGTGGPLVSANPNCTNGTWSTTLNLSSFTEGSAVTINASQVDIASNSGNASTLNLYMQLLAPTGLTVGTPTASTLTLSWTDQSGYESGFILERSLNGVNTWTTVNSAMANSNSYLDTGLAQGTYYYYRLRAVSANSDSSMIYANGFTAGVGVAITTPGSLIVPLASAATYSVSGACTENTRIVTLTATGSGGGPVNATPTCAGNAWTTPINLTAFTEGTAIVLTASHADASANTGNASPVTVYKQLLAPSVFAVGSPTAGSLALSWTDNSSYETGFLIEKSLDGTSGWTTVATTGANATSYVNQGLTQNTAYYYRIKAVSANSDSTYATANATTASVTVAITTPGSSIIPLAAASTYAVSGTCSEYSRIVSVSATGSGGGPISSTPNCTTGTWSTTLNLSGFANGTLVTITASQTDAASNTGNATPLGVYLQIAAPTGFNLSSATAGSLTLNWTDNSTSETGYLIERSPNGSTGWTTITTTAANGTSYVNTGLTRATTYYYRIKGVNAATDSLYATANGTTNDVVVTNVTSAAANGIYAKDAIIDLVLTFSESVSVSGGTPSLLLETGAADSSATYLSGSPGTALTFRYTVQNGDDSADLDANNSANQIALNGANLKTSAESVDAGLTVPVLAATGALALNKNLIIDGKAPTVSSGTLSSIPEGLTTKAIKVSWSTATDNLTTVANLQYKLVRSTSNDIADVASAETNGTVVLNWTTNVTNATNTGLTAGTAYWFNILVRDERSQKSAYTATSLSTDAFAGGDGTSGTPWQVATLTNLNSVREQYSAATYYIQTADIDASPSASWNAGAGWYPLASSINGGVWFDGSYNGNGKKISGIRITSADNYLGLFGKITGPVSSLFIDDIVINSTLTGTSTQLGALAGSSAGNISDVHVTGASISGVTTVQARAGGLVGQYTAGNILRSSASATISSLGTQVGGLVGVWTTPTSTTSYIRDCYSTGSLTAQTYYTGGLVGHMNSGASTQILILENSISDMTVSGDLDSGGLVGRLDNYGTIKYSTGRGRVSGSSRTGGLAGFVGANGVVEYSSASGPVVSNTSVGGLVGDLGSGTVRYSYATGNLRSSNGTAGMVGGLVGLTSGAGTPSITYSFATGNIHALGARAGGLIGQVSVTSTVTNSFASGNLTGTTEKGGLIGRAINLTNLANNFYTDHSGNPTNCLGHNEANSSLPFNGAGCLKSVTGTITDAPVIAIAGEIRTGSKIAKSDQSAYALWGSCDYTKHGNTVSIKVDDGSGNSDTKTTTCFSGTWKVSTLNLTTLNPGNATATAEFNNGSCSMGSTCPTTTVTLNKDTTYCDANTGTNGDGFAGGDGLSVGTAWRICSLTQLKNVNSKLAGAGPYFFKVENNLTNAGPFAPIGNNTNANCTSRFCDTFDGGGFTIRGIMTMDLSASYNGLFGHASGAVIKNINLDSVSISGGSYTGGLAGGLVASSSIDNVNATGSVLARNLYAGGIAGETQNSTLSNSISRVNVTNQSARNGGLIGSPYVSTITNSTSYSHIIASSVGSGSAAGLCGSCVMQNISSFGHVIGGMGSGGLVGSVNASTSTSDARVIDSFANGNVIQFFPSGSSQGAGGLAGEIRYSTGTKIAAIQTSYSSGNIIGYASTSKVGGLVGYSIGNTTYVNTIADSFALGKVFNTGTSYGGFLGEKTSTTGSVVSNGRWRDYGDGLPSVGVDDNTGTTSVASTTSVNYFTGSSTIPMNVWSFDDGAGPSTDIWAGFDGTSGLPRLNAEAAALNFPKKPTLLTVSATVANRLDLTWTDNASNETGFLIERSIDGNVWTTVTTAAANATSYNNTGLSASTLYYFRVSARGANSKSGNAGGSATTL